MSWPLRRTALIVESAMLEKELKYCKARRRNVGGSDHGET